MLHARPSGAAWGLPSHHRSSSASAGREARSVRTDTPPGHGGGALTPRMSGSLSRQPMAHSRSATMQPRATTPPPPPAHAHQIQSAEVSVDFLCRKFEALSEKLQHQEKAREGAAARQICLEQELQSAEEALSRRRSGLVAELAGLDGLAGFVDGSGASHGYGGAARLELDKAGSIAESAALRARQARADETRLELACKRLVEEGHAEAACRERAVTQLASLERDSATASGALHGELGLSRCLRQVQADDRAAREDLRVVEQRVLLAHDEQRMLEAQNASTVRAAAAARQEAETHVVHLRALSLQLHDQDVRRDAMAHAAEVARSENVQSCRRLATAEQDEHAAKCELATVQERVLQARLVAETRASEVRKEAELVTHLGCELRAVEESLRTASTVTAAQVSNRLAETESTLASVVQRSKQARATGADLASRLHELTAEEQCAAADVTVLCRARHSDDLAFEDLRSELQSTFSRRQALNDDLAAQERARQALRARLDSAGAVRASNSSSGQGLRPEVEKADSRCQLLEDRLAQAARDLESQLVQRRRSQEELQTSSEFIRELVRQESDLESELRAASGWTSTGVSGDSHGWHRVASPAAFSPPRRLGSPVLPSVANAGTLEGTLVTPGASSRTVSPRPRVDTLRDLCAFIEQAESGGYGSRP
eukprot:gnl/TRDRNA2_/TRDRNA2_80068_c1_seq1.p1 gnl/TRDRNA2_/TRDRNA2_80068_c1~~gnl/TRDRNA2_/TRDRNA2_80068_c1_seq1.p1  ORF type:complete len:662 (+),score=127.03 gnl/TRDRNA2_/TRDRNA2_80068_c1_seq1:94-2079(+)